MISTTTIQGKTIHINLSKLREAMRNIEKRIEASNKILHAPHGGETWRQMQLRDTTLRPTATFLYTLRAHLRGKSHGRLSLEDRENLLAYWLKSAYPYREDFTYLIASNEEAEKELAQREEETRRYEESLKEIRPKGSTAATRESAVQALSAS